MKRVLAVVCVALAFVVAKADEMRDVLPTDVENLKLWLDANNSNSVGLVSGRVSQWNDVSSNGFNAAQANFNFRPFYEQAAHSNMPMVRFSTGSHFLQSGCVPATSNGPRTIIIAVANIGTNSPASNHLIHYGSPVLRQAYGIMSSVWDGYVAREWGQHFWSDGYTTKISSQDGGGYIVAAYYDGAVDYMTVNGSNTLTKTYSVALNTATGQYGLYGIIVGSRIDPPFGNPYQGFIGDVGEVLAYSACLSLEDRQKLEGYLAHKWFMVDRLPDDHPYKAAKPVILVPAGGMFLMIR